MQERIRAQVMQRNRNSGGIGLGLTIARDAARRQGGDLELLALPRH